MCVVGTHEVLDKRPGQDANVMSRARPVRVVARSGLSAARHMSAFG
jgi:hypothetical protein